LKSISLFSLPDELPKINFTMYKFSLFLSLLGICSMDSGLVQAFVPPSSISTNNHRQLNKATRVVQNLAPLDFDFDAMNALGNSILTAVDTSSPDYIPGTSGEVTYSKSSYYAILALYLTSFPGLWSTIKRSTKTKVKKKTFVAPGANVTDGLGLREQAGEIMAYMKANNYEVVEAGETIIFQGLIQRSVSQACFLVFCSFVGLASLALVLSIQFNSLVLPVIGEPNWYFMCLLSPYAGVYYWRSGDRVDDYSIKLETNDDESENSISVMGSEDEMERMWRALEWQEKGMVMVPGLLDK